jgi:hypothetical protein
MKMNNANLAGERINKYLSDVASHLTSLSEDEKGEILSSVRAHIDNELQMRGEGEPTLEDVEEVLLGMDPPASYMESAPSLSADQPQIRKLSRLAIIGAILLPFGSFLILLFVPLSASTTSTSPSTWQIVLRFTLLPLAVIAPFASTALGLISISQIRNSNGAIYGLPLAVFVSLFYPIIILDLFLFFIGWTFLGSIFESSLIPLAWLFIILLIDYLIIRYTWRAANQQR